MLLRVIPVGAFAPRLTAHAVIGGEAAGETRTYALDFIDDRVYLGHRGSFRIEVHVYPNIRKKTTVVIPQRMETSCENKKIRMKTRSSE
jgi:hypothetical protein